MQTSSCRRALVALIAIVLHTALSTSTTDAAGFGAYFEYGRDTITTVGNIELLPTLTGIPLSAFDRNSFGVGLATDTNLARDRLFNNRLDIGFHVSQFANISTDSGLGLMFNNAFGFGLYRRERVRVWVGPAVRLDADWYDTDDLVAVDVGWGPQIGVNTHLGDRLTTTLSFAYNFKWGWLIPATGSSVTYNDNYLGVSLAFFIRTPGDQF